MHDALLLGNYELLKRAQEGDEEAKEQLAEENSRLIYSVARRFLGRGYELDDLFQIGAVGFMKAINNFDMSYGVQFSTYCVPLVTGEIKRFLRDDGLIKVSRSQKQLAVDAKKVTEELRKTLMREPKLSEVAKELQVEQEKIAEALGALNPVESLFATSPTDDKLLLIDKIVGGVNSENETVNKITLSDLLSKLPEREKKIIIFRYFKDKTQSWVAKKLGISQVQVSRIEKKVIEQLRTHFSA